MNSSTLSRDHLPKQIESGSLTTTTTVSLDSLMSQKSSKPLAEIVYLSALYPSHVYPMLGYFSELEAQGFKFDVYGPKNILKLFSQDDRNLFEFPELEVNETEGTLGVFKITCRGLLQTLPAIEAMWNERKWKPKVIIADFAVTYPLYLARKLGIPLLVYFPFYFTGDPERLIFNAVEKGMMWMPDFKAMEMWSQVLMEYGVLIKNSEQILIKGDVNFSSMPAFIGDRVWSPKGDNFYAGPGFRDVTAIDKTDFDDSLLEGDDIIFVSLGTHFLNSLSPVIYENIAEAFSCTSEKVIITASKEIVERLERKKLPKNIHVMTWVPQLKVLQHTKLFVTHAGTGGWLEGIAAGVPMLCVPNYCEQFINAQMTEKLNLGKWLRKDRSPQAIRKLAEEILADERIKRSCLIYQKLIDKNDARQKFVDIVKSMIN